MSECNTTPACHHMLLHIGLFQHFNAEETCRYQFQSARLLVQSESKFSQSTLDFLIWILTDAEEFLWIVLF